MFKIAHEMDYIQYYERQMEVFNKEIAKLSNNSEKIYRLLEAHFAPIDRGCIVPDSCPAGYKGLHMHIKY